MKKRINTVRAVVLAVLLCVGMFLVPLSVFAQADDLVCATIPVSVTVKGKSEEQDQDIPDENYTFELKPLYEAPVPEVDTVTVKGDGEAEFQINYSSVGVYRYTVSQNIEAIPDKSSRGHYDESIYYVVVTVTNTENGLGVVVSAHKNSEENDKSDICFENTYDPLPSNTDVKPATDTKSTLTIDDDSKSKPDKTKTSDKLIQTGQLNWPVPVLLIFGLVFVVWGIYVVRKKEKK